ncbi:DUF2971 domain-containing protein [Pelagibacterium montanilacus]|uniref:DUF2971 domain-containing protein n=1 Tax=Pelagibacterium montanilacus TaxID=2185280 RepID=UPI000F8CCF10|nr:DUF2971 domain-containing protein [Pelagibacterium montanilacus]
MVYLEYTPTTPLFFYLSVEAFENVVRSKKLWLTDITASNDPREIALGREAFAEAMNALSERDIPGLNRRNLSAFLVDVLRVSRTSTCYAVCFALAGDQLPMWREYADRGEGLCIAFRPTAMNAIPGRMQLVRYTDETTAGAFRDAAIRAALTMGQPRSVEAVLAAAEAFAAITSLKHHTWAHEREVRLIFNQRNEKPMPNEILTQIVSAHPDGDGVPGGGVGSEESGHRRFSGNVGLLKPQSERTTDDHRYDEPSRSGRTDPRRRYFA